jgi:hypothetical protein
MHAVNVCVMYRVLQEILWEVKIKLNENDIYEWLISHKL